MAVQETLPRQTLLVSQYGGTRRVRNTFAPETAGHGCRRARHRGSDDARRARHEIRARARNVLAQLDDRGSAPLRRTLRNDDDRVREEAAIALTA